jgi:NTE family protein
VATKRALVLAGGGLAGIGWETGILRGIADESPSTAKALLDVDVLVGTSAGSTVAAQLSSGLGLDALFERQVAAASAELDPNVGIDQITDLFIGAMSTPNTTTAEKLQRIGTVALSTQTVTEAARREVRRSTPRPASWSRSTTTLVSAWSRPSRPAARCRPSGRR